MTDFSTLLLHWYHRYRRDLPWKHTHDPYKIWLSEIILQQTRVEQGYPYYMRFIERFPTVQSLAVAHIDEVLLLWQGLGYYSRARNLHHTAQQIATHHNGRFPASYKELLQLKGIGPYTAAAIASFAYKEPVPAIDGNGYRILSRVFGIDTPFDTTTGKKQFMELATTLLPPKHPDDFNQALMDFGSLVCTPRQALCTECPLQENCYAFAHNKTDKFPVKSKQTKIRQRYFYYLFIRHNGNIFIRKRTEKDIWQGLYEFPLIEASKPLLQKQLLATESWKTIIGNSSISITGTSGELKHQLTHQTLHAVFYLLTIDNIDGALVTDYLSVSPNDLDNYSLPRLLTIFLENVCAI